LALALEQRVGGHRGAHLDHFDAFYRYGLVLGHAQQLAYALHRRVGILFGIFGQQLGRDQFAVGPAGHHVGEGAPSVYPELPAPGARPAVRGAHSDDAARAAWSYRPDSMRRRAAMADMASASASSPSTAGSRQ